jgi:hypothetical protein
MKHLSEFTLPDWLRLRPVAYWLRELRNDLWLSQYLNKKTETLPAVLQDLQHKITQSKSRTLMVIIAFEHPWALEFLLEQAALNLKGDPVLLVADNSRDAEMRQKNDQICAKHQVSYLPLPHNFSKHPNRSHGMAMTYVHHHCIQNLDLNYFGYIDHDLIPIHPVDMTSRLQGKEIFGLLNKGRENFWSLWAGYCFFNANPYARMKLNFLYDFSRELDTGGRNWDSVYSKHLFEETEFAPSGSKSFASKAGKHIDVQLVDQAWLHMSGVSYGDNWSLRGEFFTEYRNQLKAGQ